MDIDVIWFTLIIGSSAGLEEPTTQANVIGTSPVNKMP
jgi:hypothetical protein